MVKYLGTLCALGTILSQSLAGWGKIILLVTKVVIERK